MVRMSDLGELACTLNSVNVGPEVPQSCSTSSFRSARLNNNDIYENTKAFFNSHNDQKKCLNRSESVPYKTNRHSVSRSSVSEESTSHCIFNDVESHTDPNRLDGQKYSYPPSNSHLYEVFEPLEKRASISSEENGTPLRQVERRKRARSEVFKNKVCWLDKVSNMAFWSRGVETLFVINQILC